MRSQSVLTPHFSISSHLYDSSNPLPSAFSPSLRSVHTSDNQIYQRGGDLILSLLAFSSQRPESQSSVLSLGFSSSSISCLLLPSVIAAFTGLRSSSSLWTLKSEYLLLRVLESRDHSSLLSPDSGDSVTVECLNRGFVELSSLFSVFCPDAGDAVTLECWNRGVLYSLRTPVTPWRIDVVEALASRNIDSSTVLRRRP